MDPSLDPNLDPSPRSGFEPRSESGSDPDVDLDPVSGHDPNSYSNAERFFCDDRTSRSRTPT